MHTGLTDEHGNYPPGGSGHVHTKYRQRYAGRQACMQADSLRYVICKPMRVVVTSVNIHTIRAHPCPIEPNPPVARNGDRL